MGKKSTPPPPDYAAAAEKTGASNQAAQTAADWTNRPTINTPWGTQSWKAGAGIDPSTGRRVTNWTQNTTLAPAQQAALNSQQAVDLGKSQLAEGSIGRMQDAYSQPFNWDNMQAMGQAAPGGGLMAGNLQPSQQLNAQHLAQGPQTQAGNLDPSNFQTQGAGQGMMSGLSAGGDMGRQRIEQGYMDRLRPEQERQQAGLETKLQNMGLTRGSEGWNREMQRQGDQNSRQQFDAMDKAGAEQTRQFNMALQGGQFQNAAQAQGFGQNMSQNAQNFGQQAQAGQQNYAQQAEANTDNFNRAATAGAQNFGQQQQAGTYNFGQQAQAGAQNFSQQQGAQNQNYNQQMQTANYQNQLRQQQISEQQMQRAMPLNEMNAILTGAQVGMPTMPGFNASKSAGGVDYSGAAQNQYSAAMDSYNAKAQQAQGMMSGLGGLASTAMMFSDRRLKSNIVKVDDHPIGVAVYEYDIFGRRERGVMAQELMLVAPERVNTHPSGFLMVDYRGM